MSLSSRTWTPQLRICLRLRRSSGRARTTGRSTGRSVWTCCWSSACSLRSPSGRPGTGWRGRRAGVPVRTILVSDASRRTRKHNAYVSGLGPTRRLVLFDTLLEDVPREELRGVVAHELGHRRHRHVAAGTLLAMAGIAVAVLVLWGLLSWHGLLAAVGADGLAGPRVVPLVLLALSLLELGALP